MPKIFTQLVLLTFFLTAATGVMMRLVPFSTTIAHIPYDHLLHAHSHIALLGWTFKSRVCSLFNHPVYASHFRTVLDSYIYV